MTGRESFGAFRRCFPGQGWRRRSRRRHRSRRDAALRPGSPAERRAAQGYPCPPGPTRSTSISDVDAPVGGRSPTSTSSTTMRRALARQPALTGADFTDTRRCQSFTLERCCPATTDLDFRTRSYGAAFSTCKVVVRRSHHPAKVTGGVTLSVLVTTFGRRQYLEPAACARSLARSGCPDELVLVTRQARCRFRRHS